MPRIELMPKKKGSDRLCSFSFSQVDFLVVFPSYEKEVVNDLPRAVLFLLFSSFKPSGTQVQIVLINQLFCHDVDCYMTSVKLCNTVLHLETSFTVSVGTGRSTINHMMTSCSQSSKTA